MTGVQTCALPIWDELNLQRSRSQLDAPGHVAENPASKRYKFQYYTPLANSFVHYPLDNQPPTEPLAIVS